MKKHCQISSFDHKLRFRDRAWHRLCKRFVLSDDFVDLTGGSIMKFSRTFAFAVLAVGFALLLGADAGATLITHTLDVNFGSEDASGFLVATYDDGGGTGSVTMTLDATNLSLSGEFVDEWYINYVGGDPTGLTFTHDSGDVIATILQTPLVMPTLYKADGDGVYDIVFQFDQSAGSRFEAGETVVYTITGTGITAADFDLFSVSDAGQSGPFLSAAHVRGTDCVSGVGCDDTGDPDNEGSDWVGAVPEPGSLALFSTSLIVASALMRRRRAH
jgi:hypothetical protein